MVGRAMVASLKRLAAVAALSLSAAACASAPPDDSFQSRDRLSGDARIEQPARPLQCVPFARQLTGIPIHGDAWTWWAQSEGRYRHSRAPESGAIIVLAGYAGPHRAHLAVVRSVISSREIRVDHANWLDRGNIHLDDPMIDVSPDNDWSQVRVFNLASGAWGGHSYPVRGFIGPGQDADAMRMADRD